jgi:hypothetical protein
MKWIQQQKADESLQRHAQRPGDDEACDLLDIGYSVESVVVVSLVCHAVDRALFLSGQV